MFGHLQAQFAPFAVTIIFSRLKIYKEIVPGVIFITMSDHHTKLAKPYGSRLLRLPIDDKSPEIGNTLNRTQVIVIAGETGSGKSTRLPRICRCAGIRGTIGVTQPRRIAATSLARRVAQESECALGTQVGYRIRFDECLGPDTNIVYMTDGILLTEIRSDPLLKKYSVIIIDEAHERSLNIDFLLGYLHNLLPKRPNLKLIISSATIDTTMFSKAFGDAPIIEVSGRLYPVDVWYLPPEDPESANYVDSAVDAATLLSETEDGGDLLIFMPTERDIMETCEKLEGRTLGGTTILPLFGRLPQSRQNRIFSPTAGRKIVVATNVAETSITVPGIRFVIDTGLARIHRYAPALRTTRLPVEEISKAAADQRKGRCGRVQNGICIRLYAEDDYEARESFTTPEIQRSNLAGVILQLAVLGWGPIEEFPFLQAPQPRAVKDAYAQLRELGAITKNGTLKPLGKKMATLPLDPHVAAMILEAQKQGALREVKIIAAGLSIVDPRQRPPEETEKADAAHKRFSDPKSDFPAYLKMWDTFQSEWKTLKTQNKMRRFCKENYLSYVRMREWHDVHDQINRILKSHKGFSENTRNADYESVHKAILTGLAANIAKRTEEGHYRAPRGRTLWIFPGSALFRAKPSWIMCHEVVETSRVYGRSVGEISPEWIEEVAPHVCRRRHADPRFDPETGTVLSTETVVAFGLPIIEGRRVNHGSINPDEANDLFIRRGLIERELKTHHRFFKQNTRLIDRIQKTQAKLRSREILVDEEVLYEFYKKRIPTVTSIHDLNRVIRDEGNDSFLRMTERDVLAAGIPEAVQRYPADLELGGEPFRLRYAFAPGSEEDGITVIIPETVFPHIDADALEWTIPPLWIEKARALLSSLPKEYRKKLAPLDQTAQRASEALTYSPKSFSAALSETIDQVFGVSVSPELFREEKVPAHLKLRIELVDNKGAVVRSGRCIDELRARTAPGAAKLPERWKKVFQEYEKRDITQWSFGEIPENLEISTRESGYPLTAWPGLRVRENRIDLSLFTSLEQAEGEHRCGVRKLLETVVAIELAWAVKEIQFSKPLKLFFAPIGGSDPLRENLVSSMTKWATRPGKELPRNEVEFNRLVETARSRLVRLGRRAIDTIDESVRLHKECLSLLSRHAHRNTSKQLIDELRAGLDDYFQELYREDTDFERFLNYPRYLKAYGFRIQRALQSPATYLDRIKIERKYRQEIESLNRNGKNTDTICELGRMLEELSISLFAQQEVKTLFPISEKRIVRKFESIEPDRFR